MPMQFSASLIKSGRTIDKAAKVNVSNNASINNFLYGLLYDKIRLINVKLMPDFFSLSINEYRVRVLNMA